ncbi:MAG: PA14 domain-containing protein [Kiritimatiellaeota bacterium]|nr:PA14 domain-containing protein [Kiritimatiellota bacterium]
MKRMMVFVGMMSVAAVRGMAIQTAGTLLIDLAATNLVVDGGVVQSWPNTGSLAGAFTPVVEGQGPELSAYGSEATPAVYFAGSANSIMSGMSVVSDITGTNSWTLETWINIPVLAGSANTYFSWTYRGGGPDPLNLNPNNPGNNYGPNERLFEARWTADTGNALEHYAGNMSWGGPVPIANQWHHIVMTRDAATSMEYIYVDGIQVRDFEKTNLDILPDGIFVIGGTQNGGRNGWDMATTAYIGQIRVHTEYMPLTDAIINYVQERAAYGAPGYSRWNNGSQVPQPWETVENWWLNALPDNNSRVVINNGGSAELTTAHGPLRSLTVTAGELTLSGAAALEMNVGTAGMPLYVANAADATAALNIVEGSLTLWDNVQGTHVVLASSAGALGTITVGGGALPAEFLFSRNMLIASVAGSEGHLTIEPNGAVALAEGTSGWIVVGHGGVGTVTVNGGSLSYDRLGLVHHGGTGILYLNDGEVRTTASFYFSDGDEKPDSQAIAYLNGGTLQIPRFEVIKTAGTNEIYFNGTVIKNMAGDQKDFLTGMSAAYVQEGGAIFDIGAYDNNTWTGIAQALLHDPALGATPDGGLVKRGDGLLILNGTNTFTGDIIVEDGALWFSSPESLMNYTGTIRLTSPNAGVGFELDIPGSVGILLSKVSTDSVGYIAVYPYPEPPASGTGNASETFDFSNHPYLSLGIAHRNAVFTGTFIPYATSHPYVFIPNDNGALTFNEVIADGSSVTLNGSGRGALTLGGANTYTGGTIINGGKLVMAHVDALGASGAIAIRNGAALKFDAAGTDVAALLSRITTDSRGYILLGTDTADADLDLRGYPGLTVGTDVGSLTYNGVITPDNDLYRLGGGNVGWRVTGNQGLVLTNLTDGASTTRSVLIEGAGIVQIRGADTTYSGGMVITNNGALFLSEDRAFGEPPLGPVADHVTVDGGAIRIANVNTKVNENRGLLIDGLGLEWHPWSGCLLTWGGDLSGSGPMFTTDGGSIYFGGANNTWDGVATINSGATLGVGDGENFSWNNAAVINGINGFFGVNYNQDFLWSTFFDRPLGTGEGEAAAIGLRKIGTGTLYADVPQVYTRETRVEGGALVVVDPDAIPSGAGKGDVSVLANATIDVNGFNLMFNKLHNVGNVIDNLGTATELVVGDGGNFTLEAKIDTHMTLWKVGTGTMSLNANAVAGPLEVAAGTVQLNVPANTPSVTHLHPGTAIQTSTVSNDRATPPLDVMRGLKSYYYGPDRGGVGTGNINSLDAMRNLIMGEEPTLISDTLCIGDTLEFGHEGQYFPAPFTNISGEPEVQNFIAVFMGYFVAPETGTYDFGLQSDDGSVLYLDGKLLVNLNTDRGYGGIGQIPVTNSVELAAGYHPMVIGFYQKGGGWGLTVFAQLPGEEELTPIPQDLLRPADTFWLARAFDLSGDNGTRLTVSGPATFEFNTLQDTVFSGSVTSTDTLAHIIKTGPARHTIATEALDLNGNVTLFEGALAFDSIGTVNADIALDTGAALAVMRPFTGLLGRYYNDPTKSENDHDPLIPSDRFDDLGYLEAAIASLTTYVTSVPTPVVFDFARNGSGFPPPYTFISLEIFEGHFFQVFWKGYINLPETGEYIFSTASDDGSMLFIDREVVVWNNRSQPVTEESGTGAFTAGWHEITIAYYQGGGGYGLQAFIEGPGMPKQLIPNAMLRPSPYMTPEEATLFVALTLGGKLSGEGTIDIEDVGSLNLAAQDSYTFPGSFAGGRFTSIVKTEAGTVTLTGDSSAFDGTIYIADGNIALADGGTLGNARIVTSANGGVVFDAEAAARFEGTIEGPGRITFNGSGPFTLLRGLDNFSGAIDFNGDTALNLSGPQMNMRADQIKGAATVTLTDGAVLAITSPADFPADIVASNAVISLAITNTPSAWALDKLRILADSEVTVLCSGLWGTHYNLRDGNGRDTDAITNAFQTITGAENFLSDAGNAIFSHTASTWEAGDTMDFGETALGNVRVPGYPPDAQYFAAIYRGKILIPETGRYCLAAVSDDTSRVFIDGALIVGNDDGMHGMWRKVGYATLSAGFHDIVILYCQLGTDLGFRFEMSAGDADGLTAVPNHLLFANTGDIPAYALHIADLGVENPGRGALTFDGPGTLGMTALSFDLGAVLDLTGGAAVSGATLTATVSEDLPKGKLTLIGDLTKAPAPALDLTGITRTVIGPDRSQLVYRNGNLYISRVAGTVLILR